MPIDPGRAPTLLDLAAAAVAACRQPGTTPRDAVAAVAGAAQLADRPRIDLARTVYAVVQDERRLAFLLDGPAFTVLSPATRDKVLVLAARVARGWITAAEASMRCFQRTGVSLDLSVVRDAEARLQAVADPVQRFAVRHSLPDWLAAALVQEHGDGAEALAAALGQPPPRTLRANLLRVDSREQLADELTAAGVHTEPTRFSPHGLQVLDATPLFRLEAWLAGRFEQQDEASQLCALLVAPPPGGVVLDACAGSGGKSLALAALLRNKGEILATDVHAGRLRELGERARRAGAHDVRTAAIGEDAWPEAVAAFAARADRILLDVPCSGIGALRRRPEARWSLRPPALAAMRATQAALLDRALAALKPGARVVYATCTVFADENELQVQAALARHPGVALVPAKEVLGREQAMPLADAEGRFLVLRPDRHGCDGFFAAVLRRTRVAP